MNKRPLAALRERIEATTWLRLFVVNADNFREREAQVGIELRAIAAAYRPAVIGVVEALGNYLPEIDGYVLVRDTSTDARANIAAYILADLRPSHGRWHDMVHGWDRTEVDGVHEPRSILEFRIGGRVRVVVAHDPDPRAKGPARAEHRVKLRRLALAYPTWPFLLLEDSNGNAPQLMRWAGLRRFGQRVDTVLARGVLRGFARYLSEFPRLDRRGVVRFEGDHGHVLSVAVLVPTRYLTPRVPRAEDPRLSEVPS